MSTEADKKEGGQPDALATFQKDMDAKMAALVDTNKALMAKLETMAQQPPKREEPVQTTSQLKDLIYDNPDAFVEQVVDRAQKAAAGVVTNVTEAQRREGNVIRELTTDYPELLENEHPLTKRALEIYTGLPADEKRHPSAYKLAVKEAASEYGVKPSRTRTADDPDTYQMGGQSFKVTKPNRQTSSDDLDPATIEFARQLGRDVTDKKVLDNLKKHSKRNTWNRFP